MSRILLTLLCLFSLFQKSKAQFISKQETAIVASNVLFGGITTGFGAEFLLNVNRVRSQLMADKKAGKTVTDTQVLDAMLGSEVFPMIDALGIGARGLDTPAEREFLRGVFTGTIQMNKDTLVRLTEIRKNVAERAVAKFNKRLGEGYFKRYEEALGRNLKPIELSAQEPSVSNW